MTARVYYYGFNGTVGSYASYGSMIETLAAGQMPVGWLWGDEAPFDREYIAQQDRYSLVEMYSTLNDHDYVEVLLFDGEPIGVLDDATIGPADLADYETHAEMERRQGAEDAARELHADSHAELRRAAE